MSRIATTVRQIAPQCATVYLQGLDAVDLSKYGLDDTQPLRQAHFLGQFLGETGGGEVLQESGNYTHAERIMEIFGVGRHSAAVTQTEAEKIVALAMPAREQALFERVYGAGNPHMMTILGNRPGDGWPFRGTGPLQSTGRGAAKRWADKLGITFLNDQQWMLDPKIVFLPSLFEWSAGNLNTFADRNDDRHIRRVINGGYNGYDACEAWRDKAWAALRNPQAHPEQAWAAGAANPAMSAIQNSLNLLGYAPKLTVDGRLGPATKAAVVWYQRANELKPDGIPGPSTLMSINLRFAAKRAA